MALRKRDALALFTLAATALTVSVVGVDGWILAVWLLSGGVLVVLGTIGFLLQREFRATTPGPGGNRLVWTAAGVAMFVSCTMAAGLVRREDAIVELFSLLGLLMILGVVLVRLAYHPDADAGVATRRENDRNA